MLVTGKKSKKTLAEKYNDKKAKSSTKKTVTKKKISKSTKKLHFSVFFQG